MLHLNSSAKNNIELPAFSTLERIASHERQCVHDSLYLQITSSLTTSQREALDALLLVHDGEQTTGFSWIKQTPGPATFQHFHLWAERLAFLDNIIDPHPFFPGCGPYKSSPVCSGSNGLFYWRYERDP